MEEERRRSEEEEQSLLRVGAGGHLERVGTFEREPSHVAACVSSLHFCALAQLSPSLWGGWSGTVALGPFCFTITVTLILVAV